MTNCLDKFSIILNEGIIKRGSSINFIKKFFFKLILSNKISINTTIADRRKQSNKIDLLLLKSEINAIDNKNRIKKKIFFRNMVYFKKRFREKNYNW